MLNELKMIADAISDAQELHRTIQVASPMNRLKVLRLKVLIRPDDSVVLVSLKDEDWRSHQLWSVNNFKSFPAMNIKVDKPKDVVKRFVGFQQVFGSVMGEPDMKGFKRFFDRFPTEDKMLDLAGKVIQAFAEDSQKVPVYFDFEDAPFLNDSAAFDFLSEYLFKHEVAGDFEDVYGFVGKRVESAFAKTKVAVGNVSPWERNKELQSCHAYGLKGNEAFPLSTTLERHVVKAMRAALGKGSKYQYRVGGKDETLVLVARPILPPGLDNCEDEIVAINEDIFKQKKLSKSQDDDETDSEKVIEALRGKFAAFTGDTGRIIVFCFYKPVNGPLSIVFTSQFTPMQVVERGKLWYDHMTLKGRGVIPLPRAREMLNRQWTRGGHALGSKSKGGRFQFVTMHQLFMYGNETIARDMLQWMAQNHAWLLLDKTSKSNVGIPDGGDYYDFHCAWRFTRYLWDIIGHKHYQTVAYRVGLFLHMADELHKFVYKQQHPNDDIHRLAHEYMIMAWMNRPDWLGLLLRKIGHEATWLKHHVMYDNGDDDAKDLLQEFQERLKFLPEELPQFSLMDRLDMVFGYRNRRQK